MTEALLASFAVVAFAEIGDKTMLLALVLAARLRTPWQILAGILVATIANHALAALVGREVAGLAEAQWFRIAVALSFVAIGLWTLVPDKLDDDAAFRRRGNAFLTTTIAFFLVEMGDKTQIATVALGAQYQSVLVVTVGTTAGMLAANAPAVLLGEALIRRISLKLARVIAASIFIVLGLWQLVAALGGT